jgi:hypothetical protein
MSLFHYSPYPASLPMPSPLPSPSPSSHSLRGATDMILNETTNSSIIVNSTHVKRSLRHIAFDTINNYKIDNYEINKIMLILFGCIIISAILFTILYMMVHKIKKINMDIRSDVITKVKAKQSPFIVPSINTNLPQYLSLDSIERGQNIHINCSGPYRRLTPTKANDETNITISVH